MTAPETKRLCPQCGLDLPASGGCPHCLLRLALGEDSDGPATAAPCRPPTGLQSRFFGDYEILGEIARGGMGVVYRARHLKLNRVVALKMIHSSQWVSPEARMRFGMEVAAAAQLNHPDIVSLHESGEVRGTNFFTMRLVEGDTLAAHIKAARPGGGLAPVCQAPPLSSPASIAALLIKIARAVHHAHQRGILHRDLKPSNILIDPQGEPHVADFGLAKMLSDDSAVTFTESVLGSPNYMAPEQASGKRGELTTATDVYGLGAVLYEALTGSPPFVAATPVETIRKVVDEEPAAPRKLKPGLDADLETICLKCLQKSPAARYRTAEELADDLERWQQGLNIRARPVGPMGAAWRWSRRHPGFVLLGAALLVSLVALAASSTIAAWRIRSANLRTEELVTRMQMSKAEDLFSEGETTKGLAMLAHVVSREPANAPARLRLLSALQHRSFSLPILPGPGQGASLAAFTEPAEGREWLTVTLAGAARGWNLETGGRLRTLFNEKRPVSAAAISGDARWMLVSFRDGPLQLHQGPGFDAPRELAGGRHEIGAAVFSPSGRLVAAADKGGELHVWDTATGRPLAPPRRHPLAITDTRFTLDERHVVTACGDGQIRFWPASGEDGKPAQVLRQPGSMMLRFDATGRWLAAGQHDGGIKVWDLTNTARAKWTLQHAHRINDLVFSADAGLLLSASSDDTAQVWSLATGTAHAPPMRHGNTVNSARFSPDERRIVTASGDSTARIWDAATGRPLTEELPHDSALQRALFTPDGRRVLTVTFSGVPTVWETREPFVPALRITHRTRATQIRFSPDGTRLASGSLDGEIRITDVQTGKLQRTLHLAGGVQSLAFSPDGRRLAAGSGNGTLQLFDAVTGDPALAPVKAGRPINHVEFDRSGSRLLIIAWEQARLWDAATGQPVGQPLLHREMIHSARLSPDGRRVITTSEDRTARIWSAETGEPIGPPIPAESVAVYAEFSPDGEKVLLVVRGHQAFVLSLSPVGLIGNGLRHHGALLHAGFSPDGTRIVTTSHDQTARIWDASSFAQPLQTLAHRARVFHAEFSPDGRMILTASTDGAVKLWDVASGQLIADPIQHPGVGFACFSPDGRRVAASSRNGSVIIRPVPVWEGGDASWLPALAEQVARQRFTPPDRFDPLPRESRSAPAQAEGGGTNLESSLQNWLRGTGAESRPLSPAK